MRRPHYRVIAYVTLGGTFLAALVAPLLGGFALAMGSFLTERIIDVGYDDIEKAKIAVMIIHGLRLVTLVSIPLTVGLLVHRRLSQSAAHDGDQCCRVCGYCLKGLVNPRCPECGTGTETSECNGRTTAAKWRGRLGQWTLRAFAIVAPWVLVAAYGILVSPLFWKHALALVGARTFEAIECSLATAVAIPIGCVLQHVTTIEIERGVK